MAGFNEFYAKARMPTEAEVDARQAEHEKALEKQRNSVEDHYRARARNGIREGFDDVRHHLVEEGWFQKSQGRQVTGDLEKEKVPEIGKMPEEPKSGVPVSGKEPGAPQAKPGEPTDSRGPTMHDPKFDYSAWYRRNNPTGEPVSDNTIHGETRAGDTATADLYGKSPPAGMETNSQGQVQMSDLYGPTRSGGAGEPSPAAAAPVQKPPEPDHEPGH